jgi:nitrite reductase/ring-hydroxylating ferredoxin subunit
MTEAKRSRVAAFGALADGRPVAARVAGVELVVVRVGDDVHVLYGRCPHRGARMAEGCITGRTLTCRAHGWDFRVDTGESPGFEGERLAPFTAHVDRGADEVWVDEAEIDAWRRDNPQVFAEGELFG